MTVGGVATAAVAAAAAATGRRRRLTLPLGGLRIREELRGSEGSHASTSRFDVLVEDLDSDDSCKSEVPFESAEEVLGSPSAPLGSAVIRRSGRSDEELAQDFWTEIGFPTPASRFWEHASPASAGTSDGSGFCRSSDASSSASDDHGRSKQEALRHVAAAKATPSSRCFPVPKKTRAGTWRGPVPPRRVSPPAVLGQFMPATASTSPASASSSPHPQVEP
nr:uncharacterized protein LOC127309883 [Lolium perenne]